MRYDAIIIGSGFSGICMGIKLQEKGIHNFIIIEKSDEVGGTWRENTYPGAECDIPSALYSFSFEPYPYWEYKWSHQPQILEYLRYCANKHKLYEHIRFNQELVKATWNEDQKDWVIYTKDTQYTSKTMITAIGQLHHPSTPNIPGLESFSKPYFHSAKWDHSINLSNKKVGVIGNAASAIQFIPEIAKQAKELIIFQRTANWMLPKQDRLYKEWEKKLVTELPFLLKLYRLKIWLLGGALFLMMKDGNKILRSIYQNKTKKYIKQHIKDPEIIDKLIPKYPLGAKRLLFSDNYYEAIAKENVQLVDDPINIIVPEGIKTKKGDIFELDHIIFGTGFKANPFLLGLEITGRSGMRIQSSWANGAKTYLGMTTQYFPNLFIMYGPNTNLGHNSIILMSEAQSKYISQCVDSITKQKWHSLEIKEEILQKHYQQLQDRLKNMIWNKIDNSWYKSAHGNIENNWPGRTMEYTRLTKKVNFSHYNKD